MEIKSYRIGNVILDYITDENKNVSLQIYPASKAELRAKPLTGGTVLFKAE